jgi:2-C-methyl-D-erythritol 4-phosphate cytidylyltransferase
VVVHDAARPLLTPGLIDAVVGELAAEEDAAAVIAASQVTDTIKLASDAGQVERTLDRSGLWAVQTPQAFRAEALRDALSDPDSLPDATDDAMLVERRGGRVLIHSSSADNLKVTTPFDLRVAELLLARWVRVLRLRGDEGRGQADARLPHCGATLKHSFSRCPKCGRRSLLGLVLPRWLRI